MDEQESGFSSYLISARPHSLVRYEQGKRRFEVALANTVQLSHEAGERAHVAAQRRAARTWQELAGEHLNHVLSGTEKASLPGPEAARLEAAIIDFRAANRSMRANLDDEHRSAQRRADHVTVGLIVLLSAIFAVTAFFTVERSARHRQRREGGRTRFIEALQLARTEPEAYGIVRRHLEQLVPGSRATVLNRNNSANRLEARTAVEDPALAAALDGAEPEACLAIRGGKTHRRDRASDDLIACEICGAAGASVTCVPSLVGGGVIGSVLLEHQRPLADGDDEALAVSLVTAAPIVANLRNLAIAETRAATDPLTGLPNKRTVHETLNRLSAQAGRTATPLAAIVFDLDHFKKVNDACGHSKGDEVLAAVGDIVVNSLRDSDFVGRYGGEEFLALLPDTGREGAVVLADKLRQAIAAIHVVDVDHAITASFGVAITPDEAGDPESLLRIADRALHGQGQRSQPGRSRAAHGRSDRRRLTRSVSGSR